MGEDRPFKCPEVDCWKSFKSSNGLYYHKRTHTKPFICKVCDERFAQKQQLLNHGRRGDGEPTDELVCWTCAGFIADARMMKKSKQNETEEIRLFVNLLKNGTQKKDEKEGSALAEIQEEK